MKFLLDKVFLFLKLYCNFAAQIEKIMLAIVNIQGQQFKVSAGQKLYVHHIEANAGDKVKFDNVLLVDNGTIQIGSPSIQGASVDATIISHQKGDKVIVYKKKRRKGLEKKNGLIELRP